MAPEIAPDYFVDEYQDINEPRKPIIQALARGTTPMFPGRRCQAEYFGFRLPTRAYFSKYHDAGQLIPPRKSFRSRKLPQSRGHSFIFVNAVFSRG